ncbi:hypothetical protein J4462_02230 [Candidatus Pacearchaeota archaeon]|nr:hypothetical protein [Candidatus Pacearchaeota archaeon]
MTNQNKQKIFKTTLVSDEETIAEAQAYLEDTLKNGVLYVHSDLDNFDYLLKHQSAAYSDLYLLSWSHLSLGKRKDKRSPESQIVRARVAANSVGNNPLILAYDEIPNLVKHPDYDGQIDTTDRFREERRRSFYATLSSLLNDADFRRGVETRDPVILGESQDRHYHILTFNSNNIALVNPITLI